MPNRDDIAKAKERRERRKLAREAAVEQAQEQEQKLSETTAKAKAKAAPEREPRVAKSSREQRAEERKAAEREADRQERELKVDRTVQAPRAFLSKTPTLHDLNKLARQQTKSFRSGARVVAKAAGKAAFAAAMSGEVPHLRPTKYQCVFNAQDAMAKAKSEQKTDE